MGGQQFGFGGQSNRGGFGPGGHDGGQFGNFDGRGRGAHRGGRPQVQPHGSHKPVSDSTGFIIGFAKNAWSSVKTGIRKAKKLAESNSSPTKIGKKFRQYTMSIQSMR